MKKDIPVRKVEGVALAIVPRNEGLEDDLWDTFIVNLKNQPLRSVLVSSKGYGDQLGESIKTTTLRHFFEEIPATAAVKVEPIQRKLFHLTHEYWLSFVQDEYMFDKKFIFVKGSIDEAHFTNIPVVNKRGVMIK